MSAVAVPIRVLLVDDHSVVRQGYRRLLELSADIRVAGEAGNAADAYAEFCRLDPDVVVMDISLPDQSGIEAMRHILARNARARMLVFSMHEEPIFATRAFQAGALGYVTKASAPDVLVEAVRTVAQGKRFLSQDMAQALALHTLDGGEKSLDVLSHREFEVLRLLVGGHSVAAVAEKLQLSYKTVANHQSAIRHKLGAESHIELMRIAERSGLAQRVREE